MQRYIKKFETYLSVEKNASPHTILNYVSDLEDFASYAGDRGPEEIEYLAVRKYLAEMTAKGLAKKSIARKLSSLRSFFRFLFRDGYIKSNPMSGISTPKLDKKLPVFLDEVKVVEFIMAPPEDDMMGLRDRTILETLYSAG
ncbi:MAG: site-specific integrase, partial [Candidatus Omnitrophota bacterium]